MWPSESWASSLYNWANILLVVGLVLSMASTIMLIWMGNVKEAYTKKSISDIKGENSVLQQKLADRVLTDDQFNAIVESLKSFTGQEFGVTPFWDDPESASLGKRIGVALEKAGWIEIKAEIQEPIFGGLVGIRVIVDPNADAKTKEAADSLISSLLKQGLVTIGDEYPLARNPQNRRMQIEIGTKH